MCVNSVFVRYALQPGCRFWATIAKVLQERGRWLRDPYRPELHYMRGPGPKSRAKASRDDRGALSR
jgi:hypothetical protein